MFVFRFIKSLTFKLGLLFIFSLLLMSNARAETIHEWSWLDGISSDVTSKPIPEQLNDQCKGVRNIREIDGLFNFRDICVESSNNISFGTYYANFSYRSAISFRFDQKMHPINDLCYGYGSCLYVPEYDTLMVKKWIPGSYSGDIKSLVIYKNASIRFKPVVKLDLISILEYTFDESNPDYILDDDLGFTWPVGGIGISNNGKWAVVEIKQRGIGLINIETLEYKRISSQPFVYGRGMDPIPEFAVDDSGQMIVGVGLNVGLKFIIVEPGCGDNIINDRDSLISPIQKPCREIDYDSNSFMSSFRYAVGPRFNYDGGSFEFSATSYTGEIKQVVLKANGYSGFRLDYLALGDSFNSGEGEEDDSYYLEGTNSEYEKCHISRRSYPYLLADFMSINPLMMKSVACSGAEMVDIFGNDSLYFGQGDRLRTGGLNLDKYDIVNSKNTAKNLFIPGRVYQIEFIKKYQPKNITIGIGGNDAGFMTKLRSCLGVGTCNYADNDNDRGQVAIEIRELFDDFVNTYTEIHAASPESKIFVIGYPKIIDSDRYCGLVFDSAMFSHEEKRFMNEGIIYINQVIEAAAKSAGVKYIDIYNSYGDQVLCGSSDDSALNPIIYGDDSNMFNESRWFRFIGNESFHPNSTGHKLTANKIYQTVGDFNSYQYCLDGRIVCPDASVLPPEPPRYWVDGYSYINEEIRKITNLIGNTGDDIINSLINEINLPMGSFAVSTTVDVVMTSNPVSLGSFEVNSDGSLNAKINMPADTEEGYHTIHLYGKTYSNEDIELYQIVRYIKPAVISVSNDETINIDDANLVQDVDSVIGSSSVDSLGMLNFEHQANINSDISVKIAAPIAASNEVVGVYDEPEVKGVSDKIINNEDYIIVKNTIIWIFMALFMALVIKIVSKAKNYLN